MFHVAPPRLIPHVNRIRSLVAGAVVTAVAVAGVSLPEQPDRPASPAGLETLAASSEPVHVSGRTATGDGGEQYLTRRTTYRVKGTVRTPPRIKARAWAVVDLDTGNILGRFNHRAHLPQASTIKLLTALTATRKVPAGVRHRVTARELRRVVCSCAGLVRGGKYTRDSMLAGMLLPSGNDAAEALAASHPRGRGAFIAAMNARARKLGATDTVAKNPSGLTDWGAYSSARDLLLFLRAARRDDVIAPYLSKRSAILRNLRGPNKTIYHGTHYVTSYPGSQGKSGYTTPAKNTLVVSTEIDGHTIGVATLGAPSGYSTTGARALTLWVAENFDALRPVGRLPNSR